MEKIFVKEIIGPIIIIAVAVVIYQVLKLTINKAMLKKISGKNSRYKTFVSLIRNVIKYFIIIICAIMIMDIYGIDTKSIITSLGVVGVAAGLALQDFLKDFVAGIGILMENQYAIGDSVTIDGFKGTVTSLSLKTTRIKSWTGEEKIIANHLVTDVINHTHNNALAVVDVGVSYDEDINHVEKVLNSICKKMNSELDNLKGEITVLGIEDLASSSVVFRISGEVKTGEQFAIQREMRKRVKTEFDKEKIEIPYDQLVIHNG